MSTAASVAVGPAIRPARRRSLDPVVAHLGLDVRRVRWTTLGAVVLAVFGGALVVASQRAAGYVGPVAFVAGVGEISLAALLLLRVRHAGAAAAVAATTGLMGAGLAGLSAMTGRDPFAALGGAGGEPKNLVAAVGLLALGYLVVLRGARRAR